MPYSGKHIVFDDISGAAPLPAVGKSAFDPVGDHMVPWGIAPVTVDTVVDLVFFFLAQGIGS